MPKFPRPQRRRRSSLAFFSFLVAVGFLTSPASPDAQRRVAAALLGGEGSLPQVCISTSLRYDANNIEIMRAQLRAVESWSTITPMPLVFSCIEPEHYISTDKIFGHLRNVFLLRDCVSSVGKFRLDDVFGKLKAEASLNACPVLMHVNSDIVLDSVGFAEVLGYVKKHDLLAQPYLIVGERTGVNVPLNLRTVEEIISFSLASNARSSGEWFIDYFIFSAETFPFIPPLVMGSAMFDNWLVQNARGPRIDASAILKAIHINHDYGHHIGGSNPSLSEIIDTGIWNKVHTGGIDFWVAGTLRFVDFRLESVNKTLGAYVSLEKKDLSIIGWKNKVAGVVAERRKGYAGQAATLLQVGISLPQPNFLVMFPDQKANVEELLHDERLFDYSNVVHGLLKRDCSASPKLLVIVSPKSPYIPMMAVALGCRVVVFEPDEKARFCLRSSMILNSFDLAKLAIVPGRPGGVSSDFFLGSVMHEDIHLAIVDSLGSRALADALASLTAFAAVHKVNNVMFDCTQTSASSGKVSKWLERVKASDFWTIRDFEFHAMKRRSKWFLLQSSAAWKSLPSFTEAPAPTPAPALAKEIGTGTFCAAFQTASYMFRELKGKARDECERANIPCIFGEHLDLRGMFNQCLKYGTPWILLGTPAVSFQWENLAAFVDGLNARQLVYLGRGLRWTAGNSDDLLLENPDSFQFAALSHGILLSAELARKVYAKRAHLYFPFKSLRRRSDFSCYSFGYDDVRLAACLRSSFGVHLQHSDAFGAPCEYVSGPFLTCRRGIPALPLPVPASGAAKHFNAKLVVLGGVDTFPAVSNFCNATTFFDTSVEVFVATEKSLPNLSHLPCTEIVLSGLGRGVLWTQRKVPLVLSHFQGHSFDWMVMCDSDSMLNIDAVAHLLRDVPTITPLIYGQLYRGHGSLFPTGGACYVLNRPAAQMLVTAHQGNAPGCVQGHQNLDIWLGNCAGRVGIPLHHVDGFYQHNVLALPLHYLPTPALGSHRVCQPHDLSCPQHWEVANFFRLQNKAWSL